VSKSKYLHLQPAQFNKSHSTLQSQSNKNVPSCRLNCSKLVFRCRSLTGRLFHSRGPAAVKLLLPICDSVRGTAHM